MRLPILLALAAGALVQSADISSASDLDGEIWKALEGPARRANAADLAAIKECLSKRQAGWNPPDNLSVPLKEVWDHCLDTYASGLFGFRNYGWDQLMDADG